MRRHHRGVGVWFAVELRELLRPCERQRRQFADVVTQFAAGLAVDEIDARFGQFALVVGGIGKAHREDLHRFVGTPRGERCEDRRINAAGEKHAGVAAPAPQTMKIYVLAEEGQDPVFTQVIR